MPRVQLSSQPNNDRRLLETVSPMAINLKDSTPTTRLKTPSVTGGKAHSLKRRLRPIYRPIGMAKSWLEFHLRPAEPESRLEAEAQDYWNEDNPILPQYSHWRGAGIFSDQDLWLAMGRQNLGIYEDFARMLGKSSPPRRIVEWGCGGGANAVHFAALSDEFVGLDISQDSLDECSRQLSRSGFAHFIPVLINATNPEEARTKVPQPCDLFLSTYVFELLPSPEYAYRVLSIARDLLASDGIAMIQIRYMGKSWDTKPKRFRYRKFIGGNTTFAIDAFWLKAEELGLKPRAVTLVPRQPLNGSTNYAYFLLTK